MAAGFVPSIRRRGLFSQDSFFQDYQNGFNSAVQDVMDRWSGRSLLADQFSSYRQLRKDKPQEDTIAATISDTKENYVVIYFTFNFFIAVIKTINYHQDSIKNHFRYIYS